MRKVNLRMMFVVMMCGLFLCTSCIGSFALHTRLREWNQSISDKYVNELIFIALSPIYAICYFADALVINSIEFWSGSNPMASVGEVRKVKGTNGDYLVETLEHGYSISKVGEEGSMALLYDEELGTWNVVADGTSLELLRMNGDGTATMSLPNGKELTVTTDAQGVAAARMAVNDGLYYAAR